MDILFFVLQLYLIVAAIKFALMIPTIGVSIGTVHVLSIREGAHMSLWFWASAQIIGTMWACFAMWPRQLWQEGFRFFFVYSKRATIRDSILGFYTAYTAFSQ